MVLFHVSLFQLSYVSFKDHKIFLKTSFGHKSFIPEALLTHLFCNHESGLFKVLHGKKCSRPFAVFCIFDNEKLSQRTFRRQFNSSGFKALFGLGEEKKYAEVLFLKGFPKSIQLF